MDKIIILRSAVLGDFIISLPAMNLIREKHPNAKIYLFTIQSAHKKDRNAIKVYETKKALPWIDFLDTDVIDEIVLMESMEISYLLKVLRPKIKSIQPTKCYILTDPLVKARGNIAKFILLKALGVHCPVYGWRDYIKNDIDKKMATGDKRCINHTLSCLESVFEDKSIKDSKIVVEFPIIISDEGRKEADEIWVRYNFQHKKVYIISPGGIKPHKVWPVENYIKVINELLNDNDIEVILTGTNKDLKIGERIEDACDSRRVHNFIGKTNLMLLAGLLQKAYMLIGNDGGTMHIGDALGCSVVAIMPGLELPMTVEPWHNMKNALRTNVPCAPCYNFDDCPNKTYSCMTNIEITKVLEMIATADKKRMSHNSVNVSINRDGRIPILKILDA